MKKKDKKRINGNENIQFLASFGIKTKKTPLEMKKEAEEVFIPHELP